MVDGDFFVINGDVLSTLNYDEFLYKHKNDQSVARCACIKWTIKYHMVLLKQMKKAQC